jgi:hypothetical protein
MPAMMLTLVLVTSGGLAAIVGGVAAAETASPHP